MPTANDTTRFISNWRTTQVVLVGAAILSLFMTAGCRSTRDNQIDILERELRTQEDYIYELEDYVVEYSDKLRQCRCSQPHVVAATKPSPAPKETTRSSTKRSTTDKNPPMRTLQEPREESILDSVEPPETPIDELEVPELELEIGEPVGSDEELEATHLANATGEEYQTSDESVLIPDPATYQTTTYDELEEFADEAEASTDPSLESVEIPSEEAGPFESHDESETLVDEDLSKPSGRKAERLVIAHVFRDSTGSPDPSSLLSVIEARDSRNEPADFDGKVSLMVMQGDPESPIRIKRWDFTEEETTAAWQTSNFGDGLHLELPLEAAQLPTGPFELWVRLETADGRKLLAQFPMEAGTLARMEDAQAEHLADGTQKSAVEEVEIATINPLRSSKPPRAGGITNVHATPLVSADSGSKAEPQWRAATHFSSGANSGFATTATGQAWKTVTTANQSSRDSQPASTTASKQRWTSRK